MKTAWDQIKYITINSKPERVVLRTYGDRMITAIYNTKNKEIEDGFSVKTIGKNESTTTLKKRGLFSTYKAVLSKTQRALLK